MGRTCGTNGEKTNACTVLMRKPEGMLRLGRALRRCMNNIRMYLRVRISGMNLIDLAEDRD
jgi:hypothetical protein